MYEIALHCIIEESTVLALERYILPNNCSLAENDIKYAAEQALTLVATKLTTGFLCEFAINNYPNIYTRCSQHLAVVAAKICSDLHLPLGEMKFLSAQLPRNLDLEQVALISYLLDRTEPAHPINHTTEKHKHHAFHLSHMLIHSSNDRNKGVLVEFSQLDLHFAKYKWKAWFMTLLFVPVNRVGRNSYLDSILSKPRCTSSYNLSPICALANLEMKSREIAEKHHLPFYLPEGTSGMSFYATGNDHEDKSTHWAKGMTRAVSVHEPCAQLGVPHLLDESLLSFALLRLGAHLKFPKGISSAFSGLHENRKYPTESDLSNSLWIDLYKLKMSSNLMRDAKLSIGAARRSDTGECTCLTSKGKLLLEQLTGEPVTPLRLEPAARVLLPWKPDRIPHRPAPFRTVVCYECGEECERNAPACPTCGRGPEDEYSGSLCDWYLVQAKN